MIDRRQFLGTAAASAIPLRALAADTPRTGLVTGQLEGARAGNEVLAAGGNAVDAVVCAALVAGVVAVPSTGIGGYGGHLVVGRPDGRVSAIDFNTTAPAAMTPDFFVGKPAAQNHGWLASGVPGVLAGLQLALDSFGTKTFPQVVKPAIRYGRDGFPISKGLGTAIRTASKQFATDAGSAKLFFANGKPLGEGDRFRNPDLADMLETLAVNGRVDAFYRGPIAEKIAAAFRAKGGLVTTDDLAAYRAVEVAPLSVEWNGFTVHTPPPTAGGLTVLEALNILKALGSDAKGTRARVEVLRLAWADRLERLGDPKHADVPVRLLLSPDYAQGCADGLRTVLRANKPVEPHTANKPTGGTIHLTAADRSGMMAALTFTHGNAFGAQVSVPGLGLVLGHGMSRFDSTPRRPNSPGPGKRPLHNMCPTVVSKDGVPLLALGATGGRKIPNTLFDVLAYRIGEGRPLADAVKAPRMHTEGDTTLTLEASWPEQEKLKVLGYTIRTGGGANLNAIERDPKTGALTAAAR